MDNTATILGTYQCEDGMTWQEFIESSYNIDNNFYLANDNNQVLSTKQGTGKTTWTDIVYANDVIKSQKYGVAKGGSVWK